MSPTGYYAHYSRKSVDSRGIKRYTLKTLPVACFSESGNAMICTFSGRLDHVNSSRVEEWAGLFQGVDTDPS